MKFGPTFESMGGTTYGKPFEGKGLARLWHISMDNLGRFLAANLIAVGAMLPAIFGFLYGLYFNMPWALLLTGIISGALLGPAIGALSDAILAGLRGECGRWWQRYRMVYRRDAKQCILPGLFTGAVAAMTAFALKLLPQGKLPMMMLGCVLLTVVICTIIGTYFWPMRVSLDIPTFNCIKNSMLMAMMHPVVTLKAVLFQVIYWVLMFFAFPYSGIFMLVLGLWLPTTMAINIIYDSFNKELLLEDRLDDLADRKIREREEAEEHQ